LGDFHGGADCVCERGRGRGFGVDGDLDGDFVSGVVVADFEVEGVVEPPLLVFG
jgi:hypothetical protein